jgi:hypothetical protein
VFCCLLRVIARTKLMMLFSTFVIPSTILDWANNLNGQQLRNHCHSLSPLTATRCSYLCYVMHEMETITNAKISRSLRES